MEQYTIPAVGRLFNFKNKYVNVVYYHDIVREEGYSFMQTNIDVFKRQMEWLVSKGYETLRFDDLNDDTLMFKKKRVLIAFDDGWRSNYTEIFDFMKERGLKYNVFLTVGEIGENPDYMTWNMVREMYESGLCGFGAHTYNHMSMADIDKVDFSHEVDDANNVFNKELGFYPKDFCYPFGYFSEQSHKTLIASGVYKRLYTSEQMYSYQRQGVIIFGRNGISTDDSLVYFAKKVQGYTNINRTYQKIVYNPLLSVYHIFRKPKE